MIMGIINEMIVFNSQNQTQTRLSDTLIHCMLCWGCHWGNLVPEHPLSLTNQKLKEAKNDFEWFIGRGRNFEEEGTVERVKKQVSLGLAWLGFLVIVSFITKFPINFGRPTLGDAQKLLMSGSGAIWDVWDQTHVPQFPITLTYLLFSQLLSCDNWRKYNFRIVLRSKGWILQSQKLTSRFDLALTLSMAARLTSCSY